MRDLKPIDGSELTEYVINLLYKNNVCTAFEFLGSDEKQLSKITNISETQIAALKVKLRRIYGPQVVDALHYNSPCYRITFKTGIDNLDSLLGDGFRPGRIYEICGYSAAGKSLLCTTITLNFVQNHAAEVLYIDTKRDFCGTRMNRMLSEKLISKDEVGRIMQMIKVERCYNLRDMTDLLQKLLENLKQKKVSFQLVIIDSLPAVWYLFHGDDGSRKGKSLLTKCANLLKQISKEHQLVVVCINAMVRNITEDDQISTMDVEDRGDTTEQQQPPDQAMASKSKPSLGRCWDGVPTIRLILEDPFYEAIINQVSTNQTVSGCAMAVEGTNRNQRVVRVLKSCFSPTGAECTLGVNDTGWMY